MVKVWANLVLNSVVKCSFKQTCWLVTFSIISRKCSTHYASKIAKEQCYKINVFDQASWSAFIAVISIPKISHFPFTSYFTNPFWNFFQAKTSGQQQSKWLLVNVQDVKEFRCQQLNRDVWSNEQVRKMIKENFVLWQVI